MGLVKYLLNYDYLLGRKSLELEKLYDRRRSRPKIPAILGQIGTIFGKIDSFRGHNEEIGDNLVYFLIVTTNQIFRSNLMKNLVTIISNNYIIIYVLFADLLLGPIR